MKLIFSARGGLHIIRFRESSLQKNDTDSDRQPRIPAGILESLSLSRKVVIAVFSGLFHRIFYMLVRRTECAKRGRKEDDASRRCDGSVTMIHGFPWEFWVADQGLNGLRNSIQFNSIQSSSSTSNPIQRDNAVIYPMRRGSLIKHRFLELD